MQSARESTTSLNMMLFFNDIHIATSVDNCMNCNNKQ